MAENSVFISYRRDVGFPWARLVWEGLKQRSINVFLDIESMRSAGRFDERLFNQIAARPYFATILTAGTLERCENSDDWMRREIEHAIATDRIIVPVFVAPFDVASFPSDIPDHIAEALATSNGVTVYIQYLGAALDALAEDLLAPVAIPRVELTPADQEFERRAELDLLAQAVPPAAEPLVLAPGEDDTKQSEDLSAATPMPTPTPTSARAPASTPPLAVSEETQPEVTQEVEDEPTPQPGVATATAVSAAAPPTRKRRSRAASVAAALSAVAIGVVAATAFLVLANDGDEPSAATAAPTTSVAILPPVPVTNVPEGPGRRLDQLEVDDRLGANDRIVSADGAYEVLMTEDGQLVMSGPQGDEPMADYDAQDGATAFFQISDGNFVVYRTAAAEAPLHSFDTTGLGGVTMRVVEGSGRGALELLDVDGNVVATLEPEVAPAPTAPPPTATSVTPAPETTGVIETTTTSTIPASAISLLNVSPDESTLIFEFVNDGDIAGTVDTLVIEVHNINQALIIGRDLSEYDVDASRLRTGSTCIIETDRLGWEEIPSTGQPASRELIFGTMHDVSGGGVRLDLVVSVPSDDSEAEVRARSVTIDVPPSSGSSPDQPPDCR